MEINKILEECRVDPMQKVDTYTDGYWKLNELIEHCIELNQVENLTIPVVSGSLYLDGLTELKLTKHGEIFELEIEDDTDTTTKYLNTEEANKIADYLNYR